MNPTTNDSSQGSEPFAHLLRFGLARALQAHSEELRARYPRLSLDLDLVDDEGLLDETACRALYRVFTEAMQNILRHQPKEGTVEVKIHYAPVGPTMRLEISSDEGTFSIKDDWSRFQRGALGVMGLKTRLEELGGALDVHASPEDKTVICACAAMEQAGRG